MTSKTRRILAATTLPLFVVGLGSACGGSSAPKSGATGGGQGTGGQPASGATATASASGRPISSGGGSSSGGLGSPEGGSPPTPATDAGPIATCGAYATGPNTTVCASTYLGGASNDAVNATDIGADGNVVVGGVFPSVNFGATPATLLAGGDGAILRIDAAGKQVKSVSRIGATVLDLEVSAGNGNMVVCGAFGVATVDSTASKVVWNQPVSAGALRCSIARDGTVAVLDAKAGISVFDPTGKPVGTFTIPEGNTTDIAVDSVSKLVFVGGWTQKNVGGYCMGELQVAALYGYTFTGTQKWKDYGFTPEQLAPNGSGQCADTRAHNVAVGRDGELYFSGHSAGGNSMFAQLATDVTKDAPNVATDAYNTPYNTSSNHIAYYARFTPSTGEELAGQFLLTRLPTNKGNTVLPVALAADEKGHLMVGLDSAWGIENGSELQLSGTPVGTYYGGPSFLILSPDFKQRMTWNTLQGTDGGNVNAVAISRGLAAVGGTVLAATVQGGGLITAVSPLQAKPVGEDEGFLAILPAPQ